MTICAHCEQLNDKDYKFCGFCCQDICKKCFDKKLVIGGSIPHCTYIDECQMQQAMEDAANGICRPLLPDYDDADIDECQMQHASGDAGKKAMLDDANDAAASVHKTNLRTYIPDYSLEPLLPRNPDDLLAVMMCTHRRLGKHSLLYMLDSEILQKICMLLLQRLKCLDVFVDLLKKRKINFRDFEQCCNIARLFHELKVQNYAEFTENGIYFGFDDSRNTKSILGFDTLLITNMEKYEQEVQKTFTKNCHVWTLGHFWHDGLLQTPTFSCWKNLTQRGCYCLWQICQVSSYDGDMIPTLSIDNTKVSWHFKIKSEREKMCPIVGCEEILMKKLLPPFDQLQNADEMQRLYNNYCSISNE